MNPQSNGPQSLAGREPKFAALKRLRKEGREAEFRKRQAWFHGVSGGRLPRTEAFYAALAEFEPL